jgi:hypothetical protein
VAGFVGDHNLHGSVPLTATKEASLHDRSVTVICRHNQSCYRSCRS